MDQRLKDAIEHSGNSLHLEVVELLENEGWDPELAVYYCDDITDKPREIDIIATKEIPFLESNSPYFKIALFIECKHFSDEFAFRTIKNIRKISKDAITIWGFDDPYWICRDGMKTIPMREFTKDELLKESKLEDEHHYLVKKEMAKLYDAIKQNTERAIFEAITQPIKSLIFYKSKLGSHIIYYPIVVYKGIDGIYVFESGQPRPADLDKLKPEQEIIFSLRYSYKDINDPEKEFTVSNFCIDFIHLSKFKDYLLSIIEKESNAIRDCLRRCWNEKNSIIQ